MPLSSADRSFGVIALQRKYVSRDALVAAEKELDARRSSGVSVALGDLLLQRQLVSGRQKAKVEKIRGPHGRHCHACARVTFLLPGEDDATLPCEHCGGRLRQRAPEHILEAVDDETPVGRIVAVTGGSDPKRETEKLRRLQESSANLKTVEDPDTESTKPLVPRGTRRVAPPSARLSVAASPSPVAGADRFAPPPEPAEPGAPPPTRRFAIAGLPTPVPGDGVPAPQEAAAPAPEPGVLDEIAGIFGYPFTGLGIVFITLPAVVGAIFVGVHAVALGLALAVLVYHAKATEQVVAGDGPPPPPALVELFRLAYAPLVALVACFAPLILVFSFDLKAFFSAPDETAEATVSIGNEAHQKASKATKFTGVSVSDLVLRDVSGHDYRLGDREGRWLVLGLLSRRDVSPEEAELAEKEKQDLARLADADKDVDVAAVWIDPEDKLARGAQPAHATALRILRARDSALPPPLEDARPNVPTVFIISPKGEVKRELDHGASDEALFGALLVLKRGGQLGAIHPVPLYGQVRGFGAGGVSPLAAVLFFVGAFYWPMALLMTTFGDPVRAFRYHEGVRAILTTLGDYMLVHAVAGACAVVALIVRGVVGNLLGLPEARAFASWWLGIAATLALSSAIGRYYRHNSNEFSWARSKSALRPAAVPVLAEPAPTLEPHERSDAR